MKKILLLICTAISLYACKQGSSELKVATELNPATDALAVKMDSIYTHGAIVGFSAAIITPNEVLFSKGYGNSDLGKDKEYTTKTIQNIGSISKTFIGISLLKAQELGKLHLDDAVNKYLPFTVKNPNFPETPITIRQLATHTSSIVDTDYYGLSYVLIADSLAPNEKSQSYFNASKTKTSMEEYLEKVVSENGIWNKGESFANYAPGTSYQYTNVGATLAALVLEKASGVPFNKFTREHILTPLQMNSSGWSNSEVDIKNRSRSFTRKDTLVARYELITYPDGGFITSTDELSLYLMELMKGKAGSGTLLSVESYAQLFTKQLSKEQLPEGSQEGNSGIFMDFSKHGVGHNGGDPGILAFMYFNPETNIGKIVSMNTDLDEDPNVLATFKALWKTMGAYENSLEK